MGVGRIYSIQGSKGGGIFSKFRGELAKRGELKNSGGFGPWMKLCFEDDWQFVYSILGYRARLLTIMALYNGIIMFTVH